MKYVLYYVEWSSRSFKDHMGKIEVDTPQSSCIIWPDKYEPGTEPPGHWKDEDCNVVDNCCTDCGVYHGDPTEGFGGREIPDPGCSCGGSGYHTFECREGEPQDGLYPIPVQYDGHEEDIREYLYRAYGWDVEPSSLSRSGEILERDDLPDIIL